MNTKLVQISQKLKMTLILVPLVILTTACTPTKPRIDIDYERLIQSLPPAERAEMIGRERDRQTQLDIAKMNAIAKCSEGWFGGDRACQRRIEKLSTY